MGAIMSEKKSKLKNICICWREESLQRLNELAHKNCMTRSEYLRHLVEKDAKKNPS